MPRSTVRPFVCFLVGLSLATAAQAADPVRRDAVPVVQPTATLVAMAVPANLFEIETGKLALDRSGSAAVKDFARRMSAVTRRAARRYR